MFQKTKICAVAVSAGRFVCKQVEKDFPGNILCNVQFKIVKFFKTMVLQVLNFAKPCYFACS